MLFFSNASHIPKEIYFFAAELAALALSLVIHFNIKKVIITKAPVEEKTSVKVEET